MNRYKLKADERHWFSNNNLSLRIAIPRCRQADPGSFCYEEDISRIKYREYVYGGVSVYRVKTFKSKLLRVMYE